MQNAAIFMADGCEEVEALTVVDMLRRAGIVIDMVSVTDRIRIVSSHKIEITLDKTIDEVDFAGLDMIILPGGIPGVPNLERCKLLMDELKEFARQKKYISAICAAPSILGNLGLLEGKKAISYPTFEEKLTGAEIVRKSVVVSDNFITSRGVGTALEFACTIIERLSSKDKAEQIADAVIYSRIG